MFLGNDSFIGRRLLFLLFNLKWLLFFWLLFEAHLNWLHFDEFDNWLFQTVSAVNIIVQHLLILQLHSNMFPITLYLINNDIPLNLLLFQHYVFFLSIPMYHPVDDFNMLPWLLDNVINGFNEFLLLLINVPIKVTNKTFVFITIKFCQHPSVIPHSCYLQ